MNIHHRPQGALLFGVVLLLALSTTPVYAEGTDQIGTSQGLEADTELRVDIFEPSLEEICWTGAGVMDVLQPNDTPVGTVSSGSCINAVDGITGAYQLTIRTKQEPDTSWDITVRNRTTGNALDGRLFSTQWLFDAGTFGEDDATNASFYVEVPAGDGVNTTVIEMRYQGLAGFLFSLIVNGLGIVDSQGRSVPFPSGPNSNPLSVWLPFYPVYLNPPEGSNYTLIDPVLEDFRFTSGTQQCNQIVPGETEGAFLFTSNVLGTYQLVCDLNNDGIFDPTNPADFTTTGSTRIGVNAVTWDGLVIDGTPVDPGTYTCRVNLLVGETHYLGSDMETCYEGL
ncbi:MAG: hypothetical protein AAFX99_19285, partial [Myxococcota bacterium]